MNISEKENKFERTALHFLNMLNILVNVKTIIIGQ
jgi:hypothetical protein